MSSRYAAVSRRNLGDFGRNLRALNLGFFASLASWLDPSTSPSSGLLNQNPGLNEPLG
jgi:hypothetical protein